MRRGLRHELPPARSVLAVVTRPGQESYELGAVLDAFRRRGAAVSVVCLTRGEASPYNATMELLEVARPAECRVAAGVLGVTRWTVVDYPDGRVS